MTRMTDQPKIYVAGYRGMVGSAIVVETLLGDPSKAKEKLGWVPVTLDQMVNEMVAVDLAEAKK